MKYKWEIIHIIDKALQHKDDGVKAYARKLAERYRQEGEENFADCILSAIGDKEVPMANMDNDRAPGDFDETYLNEKIKQGTQVWQGTDVEKFLDEVRGRRIEHE